MGTVRLEDRHSGTELVVDLSVAGPVLLRGGDEAARLRAAGIRGCTVAASRDREKKRLAPQRQPRYDGQQGHDGQPRRTW